MFNCDDEFFTLAPGVVRTANALLLLPTEKADREVGRQIAVAKKIKNCFTDIILSLCFLNSLVVL